MQEASRPAPACADQGLRLIAPGTTQGGAPGMAPPDSSRFRLGISKGSPVPCSPSGAQAPALLEQPCYSGHDLGWASLVNIDEGPRQRGTGKQGTFYL